jgi:hypothetical protein
LNATYVHDPFLTPFIDEVLENVGVREAYSFYVYHQVWIAEEDQDKTTFATECETFSYTVMP